MAHMENVKFAVVLACFLSGSEIMVLLVMLALLYLIVDIRKGAENLSVYTAEFAPESEDRDSIREEEIVRSAKKQEASAPLPSEEYAAPDQEDGAVDEDEEVIRTPPPSPTEKFCTEEAEESEEEERVDEFTEIIETFQSSEDGGKTWKTYRKTIRITPEGTSENVELIEDTSARGSNFAAEAATRLSSSEPGTQVLHSSVSRGRSTRQNPPEEKKVTYRNPGQRKMDDLVVEGPEREEVDVKEESEVLPDGTVHSTQRVSHHKVKHVRRTHTSPEGKEDVVEEDVEVPGTSTEDVYELFEKPPRLVQEAEDIEQVQDDGTKVTKHVVMNRMVHLVKMHHESFDQEHHKTEEDDYEIEEVIPGTESAFVTGMDSDSEDDIIDEQKMKNKGQVSSGDGMSSAAGAEPFYDESDPSYPKLVTYVYGSDVDGGGLCAHYGPGETTLDVVEDMLAKGQLSLDDTEAAARQFREAASAAADTDTPVIVITEDNSAPPDEDEDVLSYFGIKYEASSEGDDNNDYVGVHGYDEDSYTHRVVMKKEVHQKTTIRPDGQEDTVITEDSQVHQDSEPPEELRQSMEEIIQHFMEDIPGAPRLRDQDDEDNGHGTEV